MTSPAPTASLPAEGSGWSTEIARKVSAHINPVNIPPIGNLDFDQQEEIRREVFSAVMAAMEEAFPQPQGASLTAEGWVMVPKAAVEELTALFEGPPGSPIETLRAALAATPPAPAGLLAGRKEITRIIVNLLPVPHGYTSEMRDNWAEAELAADAILALRSPPPEAGDREPPNTVAEGAGQAAALHPGEHAESKEGHEDDPMLSGTRGLPPPEAGGKETDNDYERRLLDDEAADNLRLIDYIAGKIGLPHDQELSRDKFAEWLAGGKELP